MRGLDEVAETSSRTAHAALKATTNKHWLSLLHLLSRSRRKSNELRTGLPAKAGFDRSVPCVELEAPLWFYFLSCLLRWSGLDSASSQSGRPYYC